MCCLLLYPGCKNLDLDVSYNLECTFAEASYIICFCFLQMSDLPINASDFDSYFFRVLLLLSSAKVLLDVESDLLLLRLPTFNQVLTATGERMTQREVNQLFLDAGMLNQGISSNNC